MSLKVLYIDAVYPYEWLAQKQKELRLEAKSFTEYRQWVLEQRIYLSDYISGNLRENGFICEELIVNDPLFIEKLDGHIRHQPRVKLHRNKGIKNRIKDIAGVSALKLYRSVKPGLYQRIESVIQRAWEVYQPDIIFIREPTGINTYFWNRFRHRSLVVGLIGCNTSHPNNWLSHNFDVLFSLTNEYAHFFKVQNIPSYLFSYGVEEKVYNELQKISGKTHDVVFAGLLGNEVQVRKTHLMEKIASRFSFKWWGPRNVDENKFPALHRTYQGSTSGIEMLRIYRQAKIVVNDYVDTANATAVNLRLYEVLNASAFLLTRYAENLKEIFPADLVTVYHSETDCMEKIGYYLGHEEERETKASNASKWALQHVSYRQKIGELSTILKEEYNKKFSNTLC
jgi:hypothetical protein